MSTINYTYNVIVDRFRQFAAGHFQLRRFTHGEISQADLEKEAEWPWLHVKPRAINYSPGTRSFSFEIFISDLPRDKEDKTGYQAESITDCSLIFQDLINEIYLGNMFGSDVVLTRPVNAEPFVEQYTHTLTGVTGTIELSLDYDWSACSIPASWNYNTPTDSGTDGWGALQFIESLDQNGVFVSLLNDVEAPGNSYYYGTNASGVKGWYAIVDNVGLTCETLPDCATIISILDDIAALQTDVALKANTADLGATAFSNDYNDLDNLPTIPAQYNPTAGTGVSITGTYPNQTITNTAPDQTVALTAGSNIGVTGTYPNFTISNTQSLAGYVPTTRSITINGTTQDLSADRTFTIATNPGTVTSVAALTLGTTGTDLSSTVANGTTTPVITLNVPTASATNRGALSSADWSTFNAKENSANKQNSLATDGTGVKFPTVDAVNNLSFIDKGKRMVSFFTDFLSAVTTLDGLIQSTSGGIISNSGTSVPNRTNQQGVLYYSTATATTNYANHVNAIPTFLWFGGGVWNYETSININTLSNATERYRWISGFGANTANVAEIDGVFFTYDEGGTANGTAASPNWQCVTVANSVRTLTTTSTAVAAGAWTKLRIEINAAGTSVAFYVNGTLVATHTTNIPLASNNRFVIVKQGIAKTAGTTARLVYCDYLGYENILTTPR